MMTCVYRWKKALLIPVINKLRHSALQTMKDEAVYRPAQTRLDSALVRD